jgi:arginine utilization regulatory protein
MNKKPQEALEEGLLRKDLFYRLSIMSINIPPLRERKNDIKLLFDFFINRNKENLKIKSVNVSSDLYDKLELYSWPGNLRELEHIAVYGLSKLGKNESLLKYSHIIGKLSNSSVAKAGNIKNNSLKIMMEEYEKDIINDALSQTEYNISQAAKILNVPRTTLFRKARGYDLI